MSISSIIAGPVILLQTIREGEPNSSTGDTLKPMPEAMSRAVYKVPIPIT